VTSFYRNSLEEHGWSVDDAVWYRQGGAVVAWSEHPRRKIHVSTGIEGCAVTAITISIEELDAPAGAAGP
jgi:hypothetical protein